MFVKVARYTCVLGCLFIASAAQGRDSAEAGNVFPTPAPSISSSVDRSRMILDRVRETNDRIYEDLHAFVCSEVIERFKGSQPEDGRHIDTVSAKVSFESGTEHYSEVRQNAKSKPAISSIGGAWSSGEFGTLLRQTQRLFITHNLVFERYDDLEDVSAAVFVINVASEDSPWDLEVRSQHYRVPFRTRVWVSETGGEILKIERVSTNMPAQIGISEIRWNVVLKQVQLNGRTWLLPHMGEYAVLYDNASHREWNTMAFSNYQRYGSEVAIRF
jgi:hypothetical protein